MERPCCRQSRRKGLRCTAALCIFISQIVPRPPHCCNFFLHNPQDFQHNSHNDSVRDPGGRLPSGAAGPGRPVLQALQAAVRARHGAGGGLSRRSILPHQGFAPVFPQKSRPGHRDGFSFVFVDQNCTRLQISCRGAAQAPCSSTYWIKVSSMVMLWGLPMTWGCMATTIRPFFAFRMP